MIVRTADKNDIQAIVSLLKLSLGESTIPKSYDYWCWKHLENPFGQSLVIVAEDNKEIVGVRAFMRWSFSCKNEIYSALRAVDTATHPKHQGKGIFKKLTLALLEEAKSKGFHFIYNTPNNLSRPGYLKMGWKEFGRIGINIAPANLLSQKESSPSRSKLFLTDNSFNRINTNYSIEYINWRYHDIPTIKYYSTTVRLKDDSEVILYFRCKRGDRFSETRVSDCFFEKKPQPFLVSKYLGRSTFDSWRNTTGLRSFKYGILPKVNFGPILTFRGLSMSNEEVYRLLSTNNFSIGDLEIF